ncbi:hypothetical protein GW17_00027498 [Ensete ventricosum]|nr:hypothetical protein GW17_00027498 [Ensete ventricosum]
MKSRGANPGYGPHAVDVGVISLIQSRRRKVRSSREPPRGHMRTQGIWLTRSRDACHSLGVGSILARGVAKLRLDKSLPYYHVASYGETSNAMDGDPESASCTNAFGSGAVLDEINEMFIAFATRAFRKLLKDVKVSDHFSRIRKCLEMFHHTVARSSQSSFHLCVVVRWCADPQSSP